jgi:hypothetical protein
MREVKVVPFPTTPEALMALIPGDTSQTEGVFQGLSDKQVKWKVQSLSGKRINLSARYFGISLGIFVLDVKKGKVVFHG